MSKMARANSNGQLLIPAIDAGFAYADPSATRSVTTLLKAGGESGTADVSIQMVQGSQQVERHDPVVLVADYIDFISHRSAALVACYSTPTAAHKFAASDAYVRLEKHKVSASLNPRPLLVPKMIMALDRALREATRRGYSTAVMLAMDKAVVHAIHERHSEFDEDGNLAIEFVVNQRSTLFMPPFPTAVPLEDIRVANCQGVTLSTVGPSVSEVGQSSRASASSFGNKRQRRAVSERERRLQSERDRLSNELSKRQAVGASSSSASSGGVTYGGTARRMGGGDPRASQVCRDFNTSNGCSRASCKYRHVCDRVRADGRVCGDDRHSAVHH